MLQIRCLHSLSLASLSAARSIPQEWCMWYRANPHPRIVPFGMSERTAYLRFRESGLSSRASPCQTGLRKTKLPARKNTRHSSPNIFIVQCRCETFPDGRLCSVGVRVQAHDEPRDASVVRASLCWRDSTVDLTVATLRQHLVSVDPEARYGVEAARYLRNSNTLGKPFWKSDGVQQVLDDTNVIGVVLFVETDGRQHVYNS